jgi:uracil-DNA glycosylase
MIRGKTRARVVVVGDFLSDKDFEEQQIFTGNIGDLLDDVMAASGFCTNNIVYVPSLPVTRETAEYYNNEKLIKESNKFLLPFL